MNYQKSGRNCPILIKGLLNRKNNLTFEIESLQERILRGPLPVIYLQKIMFHVTILVLECENRKHGFLKSLSIDQIYLNKKLEEDANVFIFEDDQLNSTKQKLESKQILFQLCFNLKNEIFQRKDFDYVIIDELFYHIFEEKRNDKQITITDQKILLDLYNIKTIKQIYNQKQSRVYLIEKPYFINTQRNKIVVKWVLFEGEQDMDNYQLREVKLLEQNNDSENCTKMFCYDNICNQQFIFMKFYDATLDNLNNQIGKQEVNITDLIHLIKQMLLALKGLHSRQIIHRDLKPQNIMFEYLNENQNIQDMRCVLIDFDRSKLVNKSMKSENHFQSDYEGTPEYQPPEGTQEKYDASYDIWQLGYIIQCILLRDKNKTYSKERDRPISQQKYNTIFKSDNEKVEQKYPKFYNIVKEMMDYNPQNRPKLQDIEDQILQIK